MIHFSYGKIFLITVLFTLSFHSAWGQSKADFAHALMLDQDYFRAISVYKELTFFSKDTDSKIKYLMDIGKAYRLSGHYMLAISTLADIANNFNLNTRESVKMNLNIGLSYLGLHIPIQSLPYFKEAKSADNTFLSAIDLGLAYCELGEWDSAKVEYNIAAHSGVSPINNLGKEFLMRVSKFNEIPHRSPLLASIFSAIFPGAGQLYCEHTFDALQAFAFVSAFAFTSYMAYKYDSKFTHEYVLTGISISLAAIFHVANIYGAGRTAAYFNQRHKDLFIQGIRDKTMKLNF